MKSNVSRARVSAIALALMLPIDASAENTISQKVTQMQYDALSNGVYLKGLAKWGAPSCPNATWIYLPGDRANRKELLAVLLAAKAAGQNLMFAGSCYSDTDYFTITYVFVD